MAAGAIPDPLAELKDIHLPPPPEVWPPALGWWLLGALLVLVLGYLLYLLYKRWQSNAYRRLAIAELERLFAEFAHSPSLLLGKTNDLLKRVALTRNPREKIAGLTGESWVAFLDEGINTHEFSMGVGQVLITGPYAPDSTEAMDPDALMQLAATWIRKHKVVNDA